MHPMDSSLDESVHVNGQRSVPKRNTSGESIPGRRRTSLDNSCLLTSESVMLEILRNNNCAASIDDHYDDSNTMNTMGAISKQSRRSSLDNERSIPITFLADSKNSSTQVKVDLDHDSHMNTSNGSRRSPNQLKKNSVTSRCDELPPVVNTESLPLTTTNESAVESATAETGDINIQVASVPPNNINNDDDTDEEDDDEFNDEDSFCDATGQEMGNKAYIVQELGASYYFNDEDYFNHHVKPHVVVGDDAGWIDEVIEEQVIIETMLPPASSNKVSTNNDEVTPTFISKINKVSDDDDDDDDSDDDSFCDAKGTDTADQKYLERVLGASCYWECPTLAGAAAAAANSETATGEKPANNANAVDTIGEEDEDEDESEG